MFSQMPHTLESMSETDCKAIMIADMEVQVRDEDKEIIDSSKEKLTDELVKHELSVQYNI